MLSYTVRKTQDVEFFASPHYDTVSTAKIRDGDKICICNQCGKLHLQSSWDANNGQCAECGSAERKDITKTYLKTYNKATVVTASGRKRSENTIRSHASSRRRGIVVSTSAVSAPPAQAVHRRPQHTASNFYNLEDNLDSDDMDYLLEHFSEYPRRTERRHVLGGILLGVVIAAIVAAVIAGVILL